jgi:hypothetical protein
VTDVPGKVEDVSAFTNESLHESDIAGIAFDDFDVVFDRIEIEVVGSARRVQIVDDHNVCSQSYKLNCDVTSDEAETAGD